MNTEEKILEMLTVMQGQMTAIQGRQEKTEGILSVMQTGLKETNGKIDTLTEGQEEICEGLDEVRTSVNSLLAWSEHVSSIEELRIPKIM